MARFFCTNSVKRGIIKDNCIIKSGLELNHINFKTQLGAEYGHYEKNKD